MGRRKAEGGEKSGGGRERRPGTGEFGCGNCRIV